jgi:hypothetical protein
VDPFVAFYTSLECEREEKEGRTADHAADLVPFAFHTGLGSFIRL